MKAVLFTLLAAALLAIAGAVVFVRLGLYDIAATSSHTAAVYSLLETTMRHSVVRRASRVSPPPLDEPARLVRGAACYRDHCVQCHGGPGVAQADIGKSLQPLPGPLVDAARRWRPVEVYWITRHGIKMSGMPAWELRLSDDDLWAVTAFVNRLADLSADGYGQAMAGAAPQSCGTASRASRACEEAGCPAAASADLAPLVRRDTDEQARLALRQYACIACHRIPGVVGPDTHVGPPLAGLSRRQTLSKGLPATHENLVRWIRHPRSIAPRTAMPDMGVTEAHARLMADYLLKVP